MESMSVSQGNDFEEEELQKQQFIKIIKEQFQKFEKENRSNDRSYVEGITYHQIVLAHEACGLPLDDESLKFLCEQVDQAQTGYITFEKYTEYLNQQEDEEMMQELQRQQSDMDFNIPENMPDKLMALNKLFDMHRIPLKSNSDDDIHSQVDLTKLCKIIQDLPAKSDGKQLTVDDIEFYFGNFIKSKGITSGAIFINNVEFSTEIDKIEDLIFQNSAIPQMPITAFRDKTASKMDLQKNKIFREMSMISKTQRPEVQLLNLVQDMTSENMWQKFSSDDKNSKQFVTMFEQNLQVISKQMEGLRDEVLSLKGISGQLKQEKENQAEFMESLRRDKQILVDSNDEQKDKIDQMVKDMKSLQQMKTQFQIQSEQLQDQDQQIFEMKQQSLKDGMDLRTLKEKLAQEKQSINELNEELMHYKLLSTSGQDQIDRRSSIDHQKHMQKFNEKVDASQFLEKEKEKQYMTVLLEMVDGKVKTVGSKQIEAIVAIRQEYSRRNIELNTYDKKIMSFKRRNEKDDQKIKQLDKALKQQYEYNQSLTKEVKQLQSSRFSSKYNHKRDNTLANFKSQASIDQPIEKIVEESDNSEREDELAKFDNDLVENDIDFTQIGLDRAEEVRGYSLASQAQMYEGDVIEENDVIEGLMEETRQSQLRLSQYSKQQSYQNEFTEIENDQIVEAPNQNSSEQVMSIYIEQETKPLKESENLENHNQIYSMQIDSQPKQLNKLDNGQICSMQIESHPRVLNELQDQQNIIDMRISGKEVLPQIESSTHVQVSQIEIESHPRILNQLSDQQNIIDMAISGKPSSPSANVEAQGQVTEMQIDSHQIQQQNTFMNQLEGSKNIVDITIQDEEADLQKAIMQSMAMFDSSTQVEFNKDISTQGQIFSMEIESSPKLVNELQDEQNIVDMRISGKVVPPIQENFTQGQVSSMQIDSQTKALNKLSNEQSIYDIRISGHQVPLKQKVQAPFMLQGPSIQIGQEKSDVVESKDIQEVAMNEVKYLVGAPTIIGAASSVSQVSMNKLETASSVQQLTIQNLESGPIQYQMAGKRKRKIPMLSPNKSQSRQLSQKSKGTNDSKSNNSQAESIQQEDLKPKIQISIDTVEMDEIPEEDDEISESLIANKKTVNDKIQGKGLSRKLMIDTERQESINEDSLAIPTNEGFSDDHESLEISPNMIIQTTRNVNAKKMNFSEGSNNSNGTFAQTTKNVGAPQMSFDGAQDNLNNAHSLFSQIQTPRDKRHRLSKDQKNSSLSFLTKMSQVKSLISSEYDQEEDRDKIDELDAPPVFGNTAINGSEVRDSNESFFNERRLSQKQTQVLSKMFQRKISIARHQSEFRQSSAIRMSSAVQQMPSNIQTNCVLDHLNLRDPVSQHYRLVTTKIVGQGEPRHSDYIFTDEFYKYDPKLAKKKMVIMVTDTCLYVMHVQSFKIENFVYLKDLYKILTIKTNSQLFALNFTKGTAFLFDSYRRTEFIIFLLQVFENLKAEGKQEKPEIQKTTRLKLQSEHNKAGQIVDFSNQNAALKTPKRKSILNNLGDRDFFLAEKYGYLSKRSKTTKFRESSMWHDMFYVLCNVGLLYMTSPQDKEIKLFVSQEFEVIEEPFQTFKKELVIRLKSQSGSSQDMIMQANSKKDFDDWVKALKNFNQKLDDAKTSKIQYL